MDIFNQYLSYFYNLRKSRFIKDLSIVAGGIATAQIITVVFSPFITRLYGPEAFGLLGVFNSVVTIIVPIASLAYSHAIVISDSDHDARLLVKLSFSITAGIFIITIVIMFLFHQQIADIIGFYAAAAYLFLIPLVIFMASGEQILKQWLIRKKQFKSISGISIIHSATAGILKSGFGYIHAVAPVLLILNAISQILHTFLLWLRAAPTLLINRQDYTRSIPAADKSIKEIAHHYRDFPLYRSPQVFINSVSQNLPTIMLAALFGPVPAGFYAISRRVLKLPSMLIAKSVGTVFLPRIAEAAHRGEILQPYIIKATGGLALTGIIPFSIVVVFGPWLFGFVFGSEWVTAGEYARWLAVWLYFAFINVPSVKAIPLLGLQGLFLIYEVVSIALRTGMIVLGAAIFKSELLSLALFSSAGVFLNLFLVIWVISSSRYPAKQRI